MNESLPTNNLYSQDSVYFPVHRRWLFIRATSSSAVLFALIGLVLGAFLSGLGHFHSEEVLRLSGLFLLFALIAGVLAGTSITLLLSQLKPVHISNTHLHAHQFNGTFENIALTQIATIKHRRFFWLTYLCVSAHKSANTADLNPKSTVTLWIPNFLSQYAALYERVEQLK